MTAAGLVGLALAKIASMEIKNKRIIVTGAASGIGKALSLLFALAGARVALFDVNEDALEEAVEEVGATGGKALSRVVDVGDYAAFKTATDAVVEEMGGLDVFVNNAGLGIVGDFDAQTAEDIDAITRVNYLGMVYGSHIAIGHFYPQGRGHLVNVASGTGLQGFPRMALYCGTKGGVVRFSESLRFECREKGIDISVALPSSTDTPMLMDRLNGPDEAMPGILMAIPMCKTEDVAESIVEGIRKKRLMIFPTFLDRLAFYCKRFAPGLFELGISLVGFRGFRWRRDRLMDKYGTGK